MINIAVYLIFTWIHRGRFGEGNGYPFQHSCLEKSQGQRSLVGYSSWSQIDLDTIEHRGRFMMFSPLQKTYVRFRKMKCIASVVKGRQA